MSKMEVDATQAISFSDEETDDELSNLPKKLVAHLKVSRQKEMQETNFPIYEGNSVIGRDVECDIHIPSKSLSKQHAVIEIVGDQHFLVDKGSRNRTRRAKLFLTPEAKYELRDGDQLTFADIACVYVKQPDTREKRNDNSTSKVKEDTSETGSESILFPPNKNAIVEDSYVYEEDSDASSDILQPTQGAYMAATQAFGADGSGPTRKSLQQGKASVLFAADSDDEPEQGSKASTPFGSRRVQVAETPFSKNSVLVESPANIPETQCFEEDSEEEIDAETRKKIAYEPTQAYGLGSDTEDESEKSVETKKKKVPTATLR